MNLFKKIWKTFFDKAPKKDNFDRAGSIDEPILKVAHKKDDSSMPQGEDDFSKNSKIEIGRTFVEHELGDPQPSLRDDIEALTTPAVTSKSEAPRFKKLRNQRRRERAGKERKVRLYLEKYGSIDKETSALLFGVKRLDCMILSLRKKGLNIASKTIELTNENGEKTKVNNYVLVNSDGAN
jgi:hypothetical protein